MANKLIRVGFWGGYVMAVYNCLSYGFNYVINICKQKIDFERF